jgi:hypothetical protein
MFIDIRIPLLGVLAGLAAPSIMAAPQVWSDSKKAGAFSNFSGTWDETSENWTVPPARSGDRATANGSLTNWQADSVAWFGGNGAIAATPDGSFTVTVSGAHSAAGIRQVRDGTGEFTLEGGTLSITGPNGIRVERGTLTVNSSVAAASTLILYLMAADEGSTLVLGGENMDIKSGSVCLNGSPGIVRLTNASALGRGKGSLELRSNPKNSAADTLDLNGLTVTQGRTLDNPQVGEGTARLVNDHATEEATFTDGIHLRSTTLLAFGGTGAGLVLSGTIAGDGTLITTGTTTVTLTKTNIYTGGTTISEGSTLLAAGSSSAPTGKGEVTIEAGGTLASEEGKVAVIGPVTTVAGTSGLAPGATSAAKVGAAGQLNLEGGLNLAEGGTIFFDLGATVATSDLIKIASGTTFTGAKAPGGITFKFTKAGALARSYVLIDFTGATTSGIQPAMFKAEGVSGNFQLNGSKLEFYPTGS